MSTIFHFLEKIFQLHLLIASLGIVDIGAIFEYNNIVVKHAPVAQLYIYSRLASYAKLVGVNPAATLRRSSRLCDRII